MVTGTHSDFDAVKREYYDRLFPNSLAPLWEVLKGLVPREPKSKAKAHQWRYHQLRPLLLESGELLTAEEAERRVLVLENPAFAGTSRTTSTLYAGLQLIMPCETAAAHRHTPSALRLMIEGEGAVTVVGGERTVMKPGDFVITPAWAYHDHANEGSDPCIWMDGLDIPVVQFFEAVFSEEYNDQSQTVVRPDGDSLARFGSNLLPLQASSRYGLTSPIFNYPYEQTRRALLAAARGQEIDPHMGISLRHSNPIDGSWAMPTMSTWMTFIPAGQKTIPIRSTDGMVMAAVEGSGDITVGDQSFSFAAHDIHAIPGWSWRSMRAKEDTFLFFFSDRVAQEKLGLFREERAT